MNKAQLIQEKPRSIELEKLVACLPGYENKQFKIAFRLTPKIYHKSSIELELEQKQRIKLLSY